jgi:hypothetical protein
MAAYGAPLYAWNKRNSSRLWLPAVAAAPFTLCCATGCSCCFRPDADARLDAASRLCSECTLHRPQTHSDSASTKCTQSPAPLQSGSVITGKAHGTHADSGCHPDRPNRSDASDLSLNGFGSASCWQLNREAFLRLTGMKDENLIFDDCRNEPGRSAPFYVSVDHQSSLIIIAIRGTLRCVMKLKILSNSCSYRDVLKGAIHLGRYSPFHATFMSDGSSSSSPAIATCRY